MTEVDRELAERLHEEARLIDDPELALAQYHRVLELDPRRPTTLYNIGLIHKYRGEWRDALHFNQRSVQFNPSDEAANWNLAIAATALRATGLRRGPRGADSEFRSTTGKVRSRRISGRRQFVSTQIAKAK